MPEAKHIAQSQITVVVAAAMFMAVQDLLIIIRRRVEDTALVEEMAPVGKVVAERMGQHL